MLQREVGGCRTRAPLSGASRCLSLSMRWEVAEVIARLEWQGRRATSAAEVPLIRQHRSLYSCQRCPPLVTRKPSARISDRPELTQPDGRRLTRNHACSNRGSPASI